MRRSNWVPLTAAAMLALGLGACGDDDDASDATGTEATPAAPATTEAPATTAAPATTEAPATTAAPATTETSGEGEVLDIALSDFAFGGLPDSVPAGTQLRIENISEVELHELVAFRLPDDEQRSVEELLALPEEEANQVLGAGPPATVLLAPPGGEQINAVGDGTLSEPGRYLILCAIPTGIDPQVYLEAAQQGGEGPPEVEGGGPPHFTKGMHAELIVE